MPGAQDGHCIYCGYQKSSGFNAEHVVQRAFSDGCANNLTLLDAVCNDCNTTFGKQLDEVMAWDTPEGVRRIESGLRNASDFRHLGRRQTLRIVLADKHETPIRHEVSDERLVSVPHDRVGFRLTPSDDSYIWFAVGSLPSREELVAHLRAPKGAAVEVSIQAGADLAMVRAELSAKGIALGETAMSEGPLKAGHHWFQYIARYDAPKLRAIAKIAFNYLSSAFGRSECLHQRYDSVRRFIRYGEGAPLAIVSPLRQVDRDWLTNGEPYNLAGVSIGAKGTLAQVCLNSGVRFLVKLATESRSIESSSMHIWLLHQGKCLPFARQGMWQLEPMKMTPKV